MALQWMILTYVVAAEAAVALILTLPYPKLLKNRLVSLISLILQPALFIVPFAAFQLLGISSFLSTKFFFFWFGIGDLLCAGMNICRYLLEA